MGLVNFGVPEKHVEFLKAKLNLDVFVEGGTYTGGTALLMGGVFNNVYTIEKSNEMFDIAEKNIKTAANKSSGNKNNIQLLKGDTRDHLKNILDSNDNLMFWLDAHWSCGMTYGEGDECPLIQELEIIFSRNKNYAILIDDARNFQAPPPVPHKYYNWPSLKDIIQVLPDGYTFTIHDDVIYIVPDKVSKEFVLLIQDEVTKNWEIYHENKKGSVTKGVRLAIKGLFNGRL